MRANRIGRWTFLLLATLGALQAFLNVRVVNPDGVGYLDTAEMIALGEWSGAIREAWSPLYPAVLSLHWFFFDSRTSEAAWAHGINWLLYIAALAAGFRLVRLAFRGVAHTAWLRFTGYVLVGWAALSLVTTALVVPDLLMLTLFYLAASEALILADSNRSPTRAVLLGLILAAGYYTKSIFFYIAFGFLLAGIIASPARARWRNAIIAGATFLILSAPWLYAMSRVHGSFTPADIGKLALLWDINGVPTALFQGDTVHGVPHFPPTLIHEDPAAFIYDDYPISSATYPPAFDPSYFYHAVEYRFDALQHLRGLERAIRAILAISAQVLMALGILFLTARGRVRRTQPRSMTLVMPALAGIAAYSITHVEPRYVAPFLSVVFAVAFALIAHRTRSATLRWSVSVALAVMLLSNTTFALREVNYHHDVAAQMRSEIKPGSRLALLGHGYHAYWARLLESRIVGEISNSDVDEYWAASDSVRARVEQALARHGRADYFVARRIPSNAEGWTRLPSGFAVKSLND